VAQVGDLKLLKVLVCGGRETMAAELIHAELDRLHAERGPFALVIHGGARGADTEGGAWAAGRGVPVQAFEADWANQRSKAQQAHA
jgi:hypothetical protein